VAALVLVSPAVYGGGGAPGWIKPLFWLPGVNHIGPLLARRISKNGDDFIRSAWYDAGRMGPDVLPGYRAPLAVKGWEKALWVLTKASAASGLSEKLPGITMPTLVLTGDTDRIVPTEQSVRLAGELPKATLVVIPQSGHVSHEESPEAFMEAFGKFWAGLVAARE
jgi:pimeloyl-ACP methyl ester carboxylesterase